MLGKDTYRLSKLFYYFTYSEILNYTANNILNKTNILMAKQKNCVFIFSSQLNLTMYNKTKLVDRNFRQSKLIKLLDEIKTPTNWNIQKYLKIILLSLYCIDICKPPN
jgi:hypothetical protein